MMQFAHSNLSKVPNLLFYKLMGSGKGRGFNPWPDWSIYTLLQVWESAEDADHFFEHSSLVKQYHQKTVEMCTLYMRSITAHGKWDGANPFISSDSLDSENALVAVITRATIKLSMLRTFWKYVPISERSLEGNDGLIYTKGIGEVPAVQMATFSIWKDWESVKKFAYKSKEHQGAIERTRKLKWYKEELFSRFQPYKSRGTWEGKDLLARS